MIYAFDTYYYEIMPIRFALHLKIGPLNMNPEFLLKKPLSPLNTRVVRFIKENCPVF